MQNMPKETWNATLLVLFRKYTVVKVTNNMRITRPDLDELRCSVLFPRASHLVIVSELVTDSPSGSEKKKEGKRRAK